MMAKRTRPIEGVQRRYSWRLYPTPEQDAELHRQAAMCADLWNAMMEMAETRYRRSRQGNSWHCAACAEQRKLCDIHRLPTEFDLGEMISRLREESPEWRELSTWTPRRVATSFCAAWQGFFRRAKNGAGTSSGYPQYKNRRRTLAVPHRCLSGCKITKSDRHENSFVARMAGVGNVWSRGRMPAKINAWNDADVQFVDGRWEISVAVEIEPRREQLSARQPMTVRFDLIDGFAIVNDETDTPGDLIRAQMLDDRRIAMQSEFDLQWPRGKRWTDDEWQERCEQKAEIAWLASRIARIRRNALHVWSKQIVERASILTIAKPSICDHTKSPRGDEKEWGANVETVSMLNRNTLSYAPAMAMQMLEYKAREIGIPCEIITDNKTSVGEKLVAAGKAIRKLKRAAKENDNEHDQQGTCRTGRGDRRGDGSGDRGHESEGRFEARPDRI